LIGAVGWKRLHEWGNVWPIRVLTLLVVMLLLIPPSGVLIDNEEVYFGLADRAFSGDTWPTTTAVFDASRHRLVNEFLLGGLISKVGFAAAQVIARSLAALAYACALAVLFRRCSLSALEGILVVIVFVRLGQGLVGGEWLFRDYEAKVTAYALVLGAYAFGTSRGQGLAATLLFIGATWFHFLVGSFWFSAWIALRLVDRPRDLARVAMPAVLFVVATAPLFGLILSTRMADAAHIEAAPDLPSPDYIYSILRAPYHAAPFASSRAFTAEWLPGFLTAGAMLATSLLIWRKTADQSQRTVALWLAGLFSYLFIALALSYFDRTTGALGQFYLFRPSALMLLLWLAMAVAFLNRLRIRDFLALKWLALAMIGPSFVATASTRIASDTESHARYEPDKQMIAAFLAADSSPGSVVLIDSAIEATFLDFERVTHHPALVLWKFIPTNDPQILEWYRRMTFRDAVFQHGCAAAPAYRIDFLLTSPERSAELVKTCGPVVLATEHARLLRWAR
jgi:hypothetical protein